MVNELKIKSTRDGYEISCIYNFPENMKKVIIAIHGFGSTKTNSATMLLIEMLDRYNIGVIALDLPSHGESSQEGDNLTVKNCLDDINSVEKYLLEKYNNVDIGFFGSSFGGYLTLLKINKSNKKYNSVVLRCPAVNMSQIIVNSLADENTTFEEFKEKGFVTQGFARRFDVTFSMYEELCENCVLKNYNSDNKILIIHGTEDNVAPILDSIKLQEKFSDYIKLEKIEGADHRFKKEGQLEKVIKIATEYILNN